MTALDAQRCCPVVPLRDHRWELRSSVGVVVSAFVVTRKDAIAADGQLDLLQLHGATDVGDSQASGRFVHINRQALVTPPTARHAHALGGLRGQRESSSVKPLCDNSRSSCVEVESSYLNNRVNDTHATGLPTRLQQDRKARRARIHRSVRDDPEARLAKPAMVAAVTAVDGV